MSHIVYSYFFADGSAYVGQTTNELNRRQAHCLEGPVYRKSKEIPLYNYVVLERDISQDAIKKCEQHWIDQLNNEGWVLLNIKSGGGLGGSRKKPGAKLTRAFAFRVTESTYQKWEALPREKRYWFFLKLRSFIKKLLK